MTCKYSECQYVLRPHFGFFGNTRPQEKVSYGNTSLVSTITVIQVYLKAKLIGMLCGNLGLEPPSCVL